MDVKYEIRLMKWSDIDAVCDLVNANSWNVEKSHIKCVFDMDPSGIVVVVKDDGEIIGHVGSLRVGKEIAMFGMNTIKEEYRGKGIGSKMFKRLLETTAGTNTSCNSLINRVTFYEQFGFKVNSFPLSIYQGLVKKSFISKIPTGDFEIVKMKDIDFNDVIAYDASVSTVERPEYLTNVAQNKRSNGYVAIKSGQVVGYGMVRPAVFAFKMFPLYADDKEIAAALFCHLARLIPNEEELWLLIPDENDNLNEIIVGNGFKKTYSMMRLYNKYDVPIDLKRVYSLACIDFSIV